MTRRYSLMLLACLLLALAAPAAGEEPQLRFTCDESDSQGETSTQPCDMCRQTGRCYLCSGTGKYMFMGTFLPCGACFGNGRCAMCQGEGHIPLTQSSGDDVQFVNPGPGGGAFPTNQDSGSNASNILFWESELARETVNLNNAERDYQWALQNATDSGTGLALKMQRQQGVQMCRERVERCKQELRKLGRY